MRTKLPYKYNKLAAALLILAPMGFANAAAPVFLENSELGNELSFLFNPKNGNSEHLSMAVDSQNTIFTSYQNAAGSVDIVNVSKFSQGQVTALGEQSSVATANTYSQLRVSSKDDSLVLAFVENGNLVVKTSLDGQTWVQAASTAVTSTSKSVKMELDSQGTAYILHTGSDNNTEVFKFNGTTLETVFGPVATKSNNNFTVAADIAINSQDRVYFVYRDFVTGATKNKTLISYIDDNQAIPSLPLVTSGAPTAAYMRVAFDSSDNLHLFNVGYSTAAGGAVYKLDGSDTSDTTWQQVGDKNFGFSLAEAYTDTKVGSPVIDLAFDSQDVAYVAFQQMNNGVTTKKQAQMAKLVNDVWTEIPYDLATVSKVGANLDNAIHNFIDIAIDNDDRPLLNLRSSGSGHNSYGYTLRANILTSNQAVVFSLNEGETLAGKLTAEDADNDAITLTLSGTDAELFTIDQTTGEISFKAVQEVSSQNLIFNLTVSATANGDTTNQDIEITLINDASNDSPDTDGDGDKDDVDTDDDNDGYSDIDEISAGSDPLNALDKPLDTDGDFISDVTDTDDDNDTLSDAVEAGLCTSAILADTDGDGTNDNVEIAAGTDPCAADIDSDNDGAIDAADAFPNDPTETQDTDEDGVGDNADAFPNDPMERVDTDGDGVGDLADGAPLLNELTSLSINRLANGDFEQGNEGWTPSSGLQYQTNALSFDDSNALKIFSDSIAGEFSSTPIDGVGVDELTLSFKAKLVMLNGDVPTANIPPRISIALKQPDGSHIGFPVMLDTATTTWSSFSTTRVLKGHPRLDLLDDGDGDSSNDSYNNDIAVKVLIPAEQVNNYYLLIDDIKLYSGADKQAMLDDVRDSDNDGLTDGQEKTLGSDPNDSDSDDDGLTDAQEVTLGTSPINADSDNDGLTDAQEVTLGTSPINADSDDDGLNDAIDSVCPLQVGDCTAPSFPEDDVVISFDATDHLTNITAEMITDKIAALNIVVTDLLDEDVTIAPEHISLSEEEFSAGKNAGQYTNLITLSVTDSEGLTVTKTVTLNINPVVKIKATLAVEPGQTGVAIPIRILGELPAESTVINYSIDVQGVVTEGSLAVTAAIDESEGSDGVVIEAIPQVVDSLFIDISEDAVHGDEIVITLLESEHLSVLAGSQLIAKVIAENKAPRVSLNIEQEHTPDSGDYQVVSSIQPVFGQVKVTAIVDDINMADTHNISFTVSYDGDEFSNVIVDIPEEDDQPNTFIFDATNLDPLDYIITATVTESNTNDSYVASAEAVLAVNLTWNNSPFFTDADSDGIADEYEQPGFENDDSRIHFAGGADNSTVEDNSTGSGAMSVAEGLSIKLGQFAQAKLQRKADGFILEHTVAKTPNLPLDENGAVSVEGIVDINFTSLTPVTNFVIEGLELDGDSVAVVIPLLSVIKTEQLDDDGVQKMNEAGTAVLFKNVVEDITIPEGAVYRKYTPENGWFNFVEDAKNSIGSAMKDEFGNCPVAYSAEYNLDSQAEADANGLVAGNQCIQLIIEDGGENDADGVVNGSIEDPGFLATQNANVAPSLEALIPVSAVSGESVSISAIGSDANGDALTYQWVEITVENGEQVANIIAGADTALLSITAPTITNTKVLTYGVTAIDSSGASSAQEQVKLTVTSIVEDKPEADLDRNAGSFGWLLALTGLFGLIRRKANK